MIIEIQHETRLQYSHPVTEWLAEFRVEPVSDLNQSCQKFFLRVNQSTTVDRYIDGFGNSVHHFNLLTPPMEISVMAAAVVDTHPAKVDPLTSLSIWPLDAVGFLSYGGPVRRCAPLQPILDKLQPLPGSRLGLVIRDSVRYIHTNFRYAQAVTNAESAIDEVLEKGMGVCQDFAHLLLGILRGFGIPCRYVSGYIHRPNKESQSHAWVEVWLPDQGWVGLDPTNNCVIDEHFVKVAIGRNFTDVPPNKGVYRGAGLEKILVRVETRELPKPPTLSWREQLPPLDVPLTAVLVGVRLSTEAEDERQQQQQHQQ